MSKWDRFDAAVRRVHDDLEFRNIDVTNFTRSLDGQQRATWTAVDEGTVTGEVAEPENPETSTSTGGTEATVDAEIWIRDDPSFMVTEMGDADSKATEFADQLTGRTYAAVSVFDEGNGLLRIEAREV